MYHVLEFAKNNGFHIIIDKTRRGGFSYMMASTSANAVNVQPRKVVINVAVDKKYLTMTGGLTDFAINGLKFYEEKLSLYEKRKELKEVINICSDELKEKLEKISW